MYLSVPNSRDSEQEIVEHPAVVDQVCVADVFEDEIRDDVAQVDHVVGVHVPVLAGAGAFRGPDENNHFVPLPEEKMLRPFLLNEFYMQKPHRLKPLTRRLSGKQGSSPPTSNMAPFCNLYLIYSQ